MLVRTAKSCGPDASTLASSLAEAKSARPGADQPYPKDDGDNKARSPGRSRSKPLNHCAGNARWQKVYINQCNLVGVSLFVSRSSVAIICCAKIHMRNCKRQNARPKPPGARAAYSPAAGGALHGPLVASRAVSELHSEP